MKPTFLLILALQLFSTWTIAADSNVRIASIDYPPYFGSTLPNQGPLLEVIVEAFALVDRKVVVEELPWSRALKWTKNGRYDGLCCAWHRDDRTADFLFSSPLPETILSFMKRRDSDIAFDGFESLSNYQVGVVRGYSYPDDFVASGLSTQNANSDLQNLRKLLAKRVDLILIDQAQARHLLNTRLPTKRGELDFIEPNIQEEAQYLIFPRKLESSKALSEHYETGLKQLKSSGEYEEILRRHHLID